MNAGIWLAGITAPTCQCSCKARMTALSFIASIVAMNTLTAAAATATETWT